VTSAPAPNALLSKPAQAGQFNIIAGQLVWHRFGGQAPLYMHVENPADKTQRKLRTWFEAAENTYGTFAFQGDTLTWSVSEIKRPNTAAWLVCAGDQLFVNTGAFLYQTPEGCFDHTVSCFRCGLFCETMLMGGRFIRMAVRLRMFEDDNVIRLRDGWMAGRLATTGSNGRLIPETEHTFSVVHATTDVTKCVKLFSQIPTASPKWLLLSSSRDLVRAHRWVSSRSSFTQPSTTISMTKFPDSNCRRIYFQSRYKWQQARHKTGKPHGPGVARPYPPMCAWAG
jgi:hypothetical protein